MNVNICRNYSSDSGACLRCEDQDGWGVGMPCYVKSYMPCYAKSYPMKSKVEENSDISQNWRNEK